MHYQFNPRTNWAFLVIHIMGGGGVITTPCELENEPRPIHVIGTIV